MKTRLIAGSTMMTLMGLAGNAGASLANFASDTDSIVGTTGVSFVGTSNWTQTSAGEGLLQISITNTTGPSVGGNLTGFAFNFGGFDASIDLVGSDALGFVGITNVSAQPFGDDFAAGAAIGGNWLGGGRPQGGLAIGQTGVFTFAVTSGSAASFSSATPFDGPSEYDFVVRFRGLADGGSSKVAGVITSVPAPGSAALMAAALFVGVGRRRERRG